MNEIKKIARQAQMALDEISFGKTFSSKYVLDRLEKAAESNSKDVLICHVRDVVKKRASNQLFMTQKEISGIYHSLYGLSGGLSTFRDQLGDLLPSEAPAKRANAESSRIPYEKKLDPLYGDSELSNEFSGVFSLNNKASFSALSDNTIKKAEKFAKLQLISLGCPPTTVKAVKSNEHFVLCNASIDVSDFTQVSVPVPVQVTNGIPALPTSFVQGEDLVKLNKENLYVFIKDKNNFSKKAAQDKFRDQRSIRSVSMDRVNAPESLGKYADLDSELVAAASSFTRDQVRAATMVVSAELSSLGVSNPQVTVAGSTDVSLSFVADIPSSKGRVEASIRVDMPSGRPVIPSHFSMGGESFRLNNSGIHKALGFASKVDSVNKISRDIENMHHLSYAELIGQINSGVANSDYKASEDALGVIASKFDQTQHLAAIEHFSKLLKHASGSSERDRLIKEAFDRGDLIKVSTSIQLYCPKLGLPASKVDFDAKGRPIPMTRSKQNSDLSQTGAMISTSKISFS
jgi:hypothetical protein